MWMNLMISTIFYSVLLGLGHMLYFIEASIYETIPLYALLLLPTIRLYQANCKALEAKDFILAAVLSGCIISYYVWRTAILNYDVAWFLYLAVFLPLLSFGCSIRYRSLM
ncbi:MAG: hypothetical protein HFE68_01175 [Erysipelotrichaceae bacterium]|nr:hypothetical protein [Erysipelotrichaceae bacterium]